MTNCSGDIGYTLTTAKGVFQGLQGPLFEVDVAQVVFHEGHEPDVVLHFLDAERLTSKDPGDVDLLVGEGVIGLVLQAAQTRNSRDGRIFVPPIEASIVISAGER